MASYISQVNISVPSSATSGTQSFTVTGSHRLLVVAANNRASQFTAITYAGLSLTPTTISGSGGTSVQLWYLLSPPIGTANIVITATSTVGSNNAVGLLFNEVFGFNNSNIASSAGNSIITTTVTTNTAALIIDTFDYTDGGTGSGTFGAGQTGFLLSTPADNFAGVSFKQVPLPGTATMTETYSGLATNSPWFSSVIAFQTTSEPGNIGKYVTVGDGMSRSEVAN